MIGIDRRSGRTLSDWAQFQSRLQQVMSTRIGSREKRRDFGSRVPEVLAKNMSEQQLMLAQSYAIDAFYHPINGISDFQPARCLARRGQSGMILQLQGEWRGLVKNVEVTL